MQNGLKLEKGYSEAAEFVLLFIQALLKTGYYVPGHPETEKAREGLYAHFKKVVSGHREMTYVSASETDKKDVMIDGIFDEPVRLSKLMLKGTAEMFIPKFLEYFERKRLTSFSMKTHITQEEFENFINIMSESPYDEETSDGLRERMAFEFIKNNIVSVSTVFNVEIVGKRRKLPWRVELALTRLKNDLSKIPLYKNLSAEKIAEIKTMVFDDIIRPIKMSNLIKDILVNLDLISFDTMGISKEEIEDEVTEFFSRDCLLNAAPELLKEYLNLKVVETHEEFMQKEEVIKHLESVRTITEKVACKIAEYQTTDESLLLEFVKYNLLSVDDLPEKSKNKARKVKAVDDFLREPENYYRAVEKADRDELEQKCSVIIDFLPELLLRSCYDEADNIINAVKKTGFVFSIMGKEFFDELSVHISSLIGNSSKEYQLRIMGILDSMGKDSITILTDLLVAKSRLARKVACEILINHGANAVPHLVGIIDKREEVYFTRNVLMILAEIGQGGKGIEGIFKKFINHEEQRVREEVVKGITNIMGINAEGLLSGLLKDPSPSVRRKAVWGLGIIKSTRHELISYLVDVVQGKIEEDERVIEQAFVTLGIAGLHIKNSGEVEDTIIKILKGKGRVWKLIRGVILSDRLKTKACEALGAFGTLKSIAVLEKFEKSKNRELKEAAKNAVEKISSRAA